MTGRFLPGTVETFEMRFPNGTSVIRLPVKQSDKYPIYISQQPMEAILGHYYLEVSIIY